MAPETPVAPVVTFTTRHSPSHCTAFVEFGGISVNCQLPRHRGRHEHKAAGPNGPGQVVIKWEDDKPETDV